MQIVYLILYLCIFLASVRTLWDVYKIIFKMFQKRKILSKAEQSYITAEQELGLKKKRAEAIACAVVPYLIENLDEHYRLHYRAIAREEFFIAHKIANTPLSLPPAEKVTEQKPAEVKQKNKPIISDDLDSFMPMKKNRKNPAFVEINKEIQEEIENEYMG